MSDLWADLAVVDAHLRSDDAPLAAAVAWKRLRPAVTGAGMPNPPAAVWAAWRGSVDLANQLYRMGLDGNAPLPDSVGMERLLLRWVLTAEAMTQLLTEIWGAAAAGQPVGVAAANGGRRGRGVGGREWAEYQVSYCDVCGAELPPDGCCVVCEHQEGGL